MDIRNSSSINRFKSELTRYLLYNNLTREIFYVYVTSPLQLPDAEAGDVFGLKLDQPWLPPSGTAEGHFRVY